MNDDYKELNQEEDKIADTSSADYEGATIGEFGKIIEQTLGVLNILPDSQDYDLWYKTLNQICLYHEIQNGSSGFLAADKLLQLAQGGKIILNQANYTIQIDPIGLPDDTNFSPYKLNQGSLSGEYELSSSEEDGDVVYIQDNWIKASQDNIKMGKAFMKNGKVFFKAPTGDLTGWQVLQGEVRRKDEYQSAQRQTSFQNFITEKFQGGAISLKTLNNSLNINQKIEEESISTHAKNSMKTLINTHESLQEPDPVKDFFGFIKYYVRLALQYCIPGNFVSNIKHSDGYIAEVDEEKKKEELQNLAKGDGIKKIALGVTFGISTALLSILTSGGPIAIFFLKALAISATVLTSVVVPVLAALIVATVLINIYISYKHHQESKGKDVGKIIGKTKTKLNELEGQKVKNIQVKHDQFKQNKAKITQKVSSFPEKVQEEIKKTIVQPKQEQQIQQSTNDSSGQDRHVNKKKGNLDLNNMGQQKKESLNLSNIEESKSNNTSFSQDFINSPQKKEQGKVVQGKINQDGINRRGSNVSLVQ